MIFFSCSYLQDGLKKKLTTRGKRTIKVVINENTYYSRRQVTLQVGIILVCAQGYAHYIRA